MSPLADVASINRSAKVLAGHRSATVQMSYDGTLPPTEVLAELTRRGWSDAHPSPPPSSAIDWSRPDEDRGLRYSLLPFQAVTTATFAGSAEESRSAADWARSILERSGFPSEPASTSEAPQPAATDEVNPTIASDSVCFEIVVADAYAPGVRARLGQHGEIVDERPDTVVTEVVFRGNRSESAESVVRFVVEVAPEAEYDFVGALSSHRIVEVHRH